MKRTFTLLIIAFTLIIACKKDSAPSGGDQTGNNPPGGGTPGTKTPVVATATNNKGQPGQLVTYATTTTITQDTVHALVNNTTLVLYKTGDMELSAYLPPLKAGQYDVKFNLGDQPYNTTVTIDPYQTITSPDSAAIGYTGAIDTYLSKFAAINTDTTATAVKVPADQIAYLNGLKNLFNTEWAKLSSADKAELAYMMKSTKPDVTIFSTLEANNSKLKANITYAQFEENTLIACKSYIFAYYAVNGVILANDAIGYLAQKFSVPKLRVLAIISVAGTVATVVYYRYKFGEIADRLFNFLIFDPISKAIGNQQTLKIQGIKTNATTPDVTFVEKQLTALSVTGTYRSLQTTDANSVNSDIKDFVALDAKIETAWNSGKKIADALTGFFNISVIPAYVKAIRTTPLTAKKTVTPTYLTVKNISDPNIQLQATNTDGFKLTATTVNPISAEKNFTFDVNYNYPNLNVNVSKTVTAVFKPYVDSAAILRSKTWDATACYSYDPETRAQSCNLIGNTCTLKYEYYVFKNSNGSIYCSGWMYYVAGGDYIRYTFDDNFNISSKIYLPLNTLSVNALYNNCGTGKQFLWESLKGNGDSYSRGQFRVLNGWLEYNYNNTWYQYAKITKLNATELNLEMYGSYNQWNWTNLTSTGIGVVTGLENVLKQTIILK